MYRYFIIPIFSLSLIHANETRLDQKKLKINENQSKNKLPALEILPAGSVLKKIRIPRYNKNYTNSSLFTAERLQVISSDEIKGSNVNIRLYGDDGKEETQTTLNAVRLNQLTGLITSRENLTLKGDKFAISSQGLALNIEKHCGFLLGRNQTIIYIKESDSMINSKDKAKAQVKAKASATKLTAKVAIASTLATSPALLTAQELATIDTLTEPSTEQFISQLDNTKKVLEATSKAEAKIEAIRKELNEQLGNIPKVDKNQLVPPELIPVKGKNYIKIKSDQILFDAKQGIIVYFGNVRVNYKQHLFTCDGELKIILKPSSEAKNLPDEAIAKLDIDERFDTENIEYIVATKNVILRAKDNKGEDITIVTNDLIAQNISLTKVAKKEKGKEETIFSGDIFLKGKGSRINHSRGQAKLTSSNGYIKIDSDFNISGVDIEQDIITSDKKK